MGKKRPLPESSSVEAAALGAIARETVRPSGGLTRFECGHVGAEIGVKAKAFVRFAEARQRSVEDEPKKKCPDCK